MTIRDILQSFLLFKTIEIRCNAPEDCSEDDMLVGYCTWDGSKLIPLDGDTYDPEMEVYHYEYDDETDRLICWIKVTWVS